MPARLEPGYQRPVHLAAIVEALEAIARGERVRLAFSVPPRFGKSSLVKAAIVWLLLLVPSLKILYVSYASDFAEEQIGECLTWAKRAGIAIARETQKRWTTTAGGLVRAAGFDGPITGRGFDLAIVDDPHKSRAEAESDA